MIELAGQHKEGGSALSGKNWCKAAAVQENTDAPCWGKWMDGSEMDRWSPLPLPVTEEPKKLLFVWPTSSVPATLRLK